MQPCLKPLVTTVAAIAMYVMAGNFADAHHSVSMFDTSHAITIRGTILRLDAINPHSQIYIEFASDDGLAQWSIEGPPGSLVGVRGMKVTDFVPGDELEACGYVLRDPQTDEQKRHLVAEVIVMTDGFAYLWAPYGKEHCRDAKEYNFD